jgi:dienelactone hydrolase
MLRTLLTLALSALLPSIAHAQGAKEILYVSSADKTQQPAMFYAPLAKDPVPMIVALHTWSGNYRQSHHKAIEQWCVKNGWAYIHPDFRGPNRRPEATGSDLVVKDIVSAVDYAKGQTKIDASSVYLVGTSGGGYTALVMAGREPKIWAGVSAWAAISDLKAWYGQCKKSKRRYYRDIAGSCGGAPGDSPAVDKQYRDRSPVTYLSRAKGVRLHINTGIRDGHQGSVPISHSLLAFNEVAATEDKISGDDIRFMVEKAKIPKHLKKQLTDPTYGKKKPLLRRTSGQATVTLFDGSHELIAEAALAWIQAIHNSKTARR